MAACYTPDEQFTDPVFRDLEGREVGAMWQMLCERSDDLSVDLVEHEALRQRRALIRKVRFLADERDRILVPLGAQRRGSLEAGLPRADDHGAGGHQRCDGGTWTVRPSSSFVILI